MRARQNSVLAALAEDGGVVVGDDLGGEHSPKVTKRGDAHEADRC